MTGSIDPLAYRYAAVAANQAQRQEVIADAQDMARNLLSEYRKATKTMPQRIIYIRDGVAEGQFAEIIGVELAAIRAGAKDVTGTAKAVTITVIILRKRHHTRLFPARDNETAPSGNIFPGMVVDSGITHPVEFDFCMSLLYLLNHSSCPT
jgi:eukaryotic translation initiation factor 2C